MNRLLSCCQGYTLVGLKDTAFLLCEQSSLVVELKKGPSNYLKEPPKDEEVEGGEPSNKSDGDDDDKKKNKTDEELNTIHAVALKRDGQTVLYCAVARGDKSLAIYKLDLHVTQAQELLPLMVYITPKRLSCMAFTTWPSGDDGEEKISDATSKPPATLLLAGDLAGDAYAYSLDVERKRQRLLLGHTASMLTGLCVVNNVLLTADRDEKIRISSFPRTIVVEGFLLGHEAYLTALDATQDGVVVSAGGDCTIRLWNLEKLSQIFSISTNAGEQQKEGDDPKDRIPTDLCLNADGSLLAVIFDQCNRLDIFQITGDRESGSKLEFHQSISCSAQPLGVRCQGNDSFHVLLQDPSYICCFRLNDGRLEEIKDDSIQALVLAATERKIVMPNAILERDQYDQIKLKKLHETRGPSSGEEPWNRVERIEIAKEAGRRHKRRRRGED